MGHGTNTPLSIFPTAMHELRRNWGWLLALGIVSVVFGIIALVDSVSVTVVSMILFGWVLLIAGIVEAVQAFRHRRAGHLFLHALNAVLSIVVGIMLLRHPLAGALVVTLLLAAYFTVAQTGPPARWLRAGRSSARVPFTPDGPSCRSCSR